MTREELLAGIIDAIDPIDEITENTVVADCDDLDSLALFNIVVYLKAKNLTVDFSRLSSCNTVADILDLAL